MCITDLKLTFILALLKPHCGTFQVVDHKSSAIKLKTRTNMPELSKLTKYLKIEFRPFIILCTED